MPSKFSENVEAQIVGTIIGGAILLSPAAIFAGAAPLLSAVLGEWATYVTELFLGAATLLFTVVAGHYYFFVLPGGKQPAGSPERNRYDLLRNDLANGGTAARIYSEKLTAALKAVEHFFHDENSPGLRVLGLQTPAPLWTANAFHRCLILAFLYPIFTIFLIWAISGEVGSAEAAFGLPLDLPWLQRTGSTLGLAFSILCYWNFRRSTGRKSLVWLLLFPIGVALIAGALARGGAGSVAGSVAMAGTVMGAVAGDIGIGVSGAAIGALAGTIAFVLAGTIVGEAVGACSVVLVGAAAKDIVVTRDRAGAFLFVFVLAMIGGCLGAANILSTLSAWPVVGPLLLFVGLLTLLNAPFIWFSLGLTRALLWRGLERQLWWPYFYAIVDAACAVFVIVLVACTIVIGIQTFDLVTVRGGGKQVLSLDELFQGIMANGLAPKYWWLYALLLSTMVPSFFNLAIGGLSLTRGIPRLSAHLHSLMDSSGSVFEFHRVQIAALMGSQVVVGVALGIAAQTTLVFVLLRYAMPFLGLGLLEVAQSVAALNLPGLIFGLL